jgi:hypothetical protein
MRILKKKIVNNNIVLDVFIICQELRHVQVISKISYSYILIYLQINRRNGPQPASNDLEDIEYRRLHLL